MSFGGQYSPLSPSFPTGFRRSAPPSVVKSLQVRPAQTVFTNGSIATRQLQLLPAVAGTLYVPIHFSIDCKVTVVFTNNPSNLVLSMMTDPSTGSEGDCTDGTMGIRGDGAGGSLNQWRHYQANMLNLNQGTNQIFVQQAGKPLWFVPRAQLTGAGTFSPLPFLTVLYYELTGMT